jgi:excisionase family DNA binding protein
MRSVTGQNDEARLLKKATDGGVGPGCRLAGSGERLDRNGSNSEVSKLVVAGNRIDRGGTSRRPVARVALADLVRQASTLAKAIEDAAIVSSETVASHVPCDCANPANAGQLLLTPEQVAEALAIGRTRVYELMASGALPSIRLGRSRRVARHALSRFVDELCATVEM